MWTGSDRMFSYNVCPGLMNVAVSFSIISEDHVDFLDQLGTLSVKGSMN